MDRTLLTIAVLIAKLPEALIAEADSSVHQLRMPEDRLCRSLAVAGDRLGIQIVLIDPKSTSGLPAGKLAGFELRNRTWIHCTSGVPDFVYDRSFAASGQDHIRCRTALRALADAGVQPLSSGLPGKWTVHRALLSDPLLAPLLAPTWLYRREELLKQLQRQPEGLFLKPAAGSQGRGTIRLSWNKDGSIAIEGRTRSNRPFRFLSHDETQILKIVDRLAGLRSYLAQPYLPLTDEQGRPHDVRLLVQKDGRSRWAVTGAVCRIGAAGSITSNLHGGGTADDAEARLTRLYGSSKAMELLEAIRVAGLLAARVIEQHFGKFAEFGFDFGLSPEGKLWLLEANSKPGRQSFKLIGDEQTERLSCGRLLTYARKLAEGRTPSRPAVTRNNHYAFFPSDYVQEVHS
ncbi:YheC/YheD family endospore coat-associated protein [Paenibacillus kobensis]|uniref:YheC/YheD family endospore coat-associated protein n=1 Tax=Paenibacillus kobensis TaxID=59841 RepID=UPI000FD8D413|nr:YheC/YheD family protein [Paenibacillus kobensis]